MTMNAMYVNCKCALTTVAAFDDDNDNDDDDYNTVMTVSAVNDIGA